MKKLLFAILLLGHTQQQTPVFSVVYVSNDGAVLYASSGKAVKVRDRIHLNEQLRFTRKDAKLVVIEPRLGSQVITYNSLVKGSKANAKIAEVWQLISPLPKVKTLDTWSAPSNGVDPVEYFNASETQDRVLLLEDLGLLVNKEYPITPQSFFFIQYTTPNGTLIVKKIRHEGQSLIFDKPLFNNFDNPPKNRLYAICYQSAGPDKPNSRVIAHFIPVIVTPTKITTEISIIDSCSAGKTQNERNELLLDYFYNNYGKVELNSLQGHQQSNKK